MTLSNAAVAVDDGSVLLRLTSATAGDLGWLVSFAMGQLSVDGLQLPPDVVAVGRRLARLTASGHEPVLRRGRMGVLPSAVVELLLATAGSDVMTSREAQEVLGLQERQVRRLCPSAGRGLVRVEDVAAELARRGGSRETRSTA